MRQKRISDRVLRKALLQAHAQIQRYEMERQLEVVQLAASPRAVVQSLLPGLVGSGGQPGQAWTRLGAQLAGLYRQYPLLVGGAVKALEKGGGSRAVRLLGVAMAIFKAVRMLRGRSR